MKRVLRVAGQLAALLVLVLFAIILIPLVLIENIAINIANNKIFKSK